MLRYRIMSFDDLDDTLENVKDVMSNILEEGSTVLCYGEDSVRLLEDAFGLEMTGNSCYLEGVVSRKKQIVPKLVETLQQRNE